MEPNLLCIYLENQKSDDRQDLILFGMIAIFGVVGLLLSGTQSYLKDWHFPERLGGRLLWKESLQSIAEKHFRAAYVLAGMSLAAAVARD
jgi:hypothetical protein